MNTSWPSSPVESYDQTGSSLQLLYGSSCWTFNCRRNSAGTNVLIGSVTEALKLLLLMLSHYGSKSSTCSNITTIWTITTHKLQLPQGATILGD